MEYNWVPTFWEVCKSQRSEKSRGLLFCVCHRKWHYLPKCKFLSNLDEMAL